MPTPDQSATIETVALLLVALVVPPVPVGLKRGWFTPQFWINILLWFLLHFPAVLHAWFIILTSPRTVANGYEPISESYIESSGEPNTPSGSGATSPGPSNSGPGASSGAPPAYDGNGHVPGDHKVQSHQEFP